MRKCNNSAATERRPECYNADATRTHGGRQRMAQNFISITKIRWHVGVDTHLDVINTHIQQAVKCKHAGLAEVRRDV